MQRRILSTVGLMALATMLPAAAEAQATGHEPEPRRHAPAERVIGLREELGLTDAQVEQLRSIREQLREQNAPLVAQLAAAREKLHAQRAAPTPEQREQMQQRREEMQQRHEQLRERGSAMRDTMRARAAEMTPEQRAEARRSMRERMHERRNAGDVRRRSARESGRVLPPGMDSVVEQMRTNRQNAMQQVRAVLTEEQQDRLRSMNPAPHRSGAPSRARRQGERAPRR